MRQRKAVLFRLPPDLHRALKVRAALRSTTVTALVEQALRALLGGRWAKQGDPQ